MSVLDIFKSFLACFSYSIYGLIFTATNTFVVNVFINKLNLKSMRNLKGVLVVLSILLLSSLNHANGQPPKRFEISSRVKFQVQTENSEIKLPVFQQGSFTVMITANIMEGELTLELYDAKGEKQGSLFIPYQVMQIKPDTIERPITWSVKREISKKFDNPAKGEWTIKIIPKNAGGFLEINSSQSSDQ